MAEYKTLPVSEDEEIGETIPFEVSDDLKENFRAFEQSMEATEENVMELTRMLIPRHPSVAPETLRLAAEDFFGFKE